MAGFLTQYLFGMETYEKMPDNYIKNVISENNHAFLIGLQGFSLLSFDPHKTTKRGLSYQTPGSAHNQEYGAFFNNMLDHIQGLQGHHRDVCTAFMAGFLCYYVLDQSATPYINYKVGEYMPLTPSRRDKNICRNEIETSLDSVLLRRRCHMEPSQLNFEALTYISRSDLADIEKAMRHAMRVTYYVKLSSGEIASGLRSLRRSIVCIQPKTGFRKLFMGGIEKSLPVPIKRVYTDFQPDDNDYMNTEGRPWYPYPGCSRALHLGFEGIFDESVSDSLRLFEALDSCVSWGMNRDSLIKMIIGFSPYADIIVHL